MSLRADPASFPEAQPWNGFKEYYSISIRTTRGSSVATTPKKLKRFAKICIELPSKLAI